MGIPEFALKRAEGAHARCACGVVQQVDDFHAFVGRVGTGQSSVLGSLGTGKIRVAGQFIFK
ncbi:MAG: hypothetical protein ACNYPE_06870 [Candidatus Azotimanducaceae bacterium WSBS_2022_MAG_OTU7]